MKRRIKRAIKQFRARQAERRREVSFRHQGDLARSRGDWASASELYRRHVDVEREDFDIWVQLGHALKETGRYDEAEAAYVSAGRLRSRDADLWLMRGHLARLRGNEAAAARHYGVSADIDGNPEAIASRDFSRRLAHSPHLVTAFPPRIVGRVEALSGGRLTGWAADPDHGERPVAIEVLASGDVVVEGVADLSGPPGTAGSRGFDFALSGLLDLTADQIVEVRLKRTGEPLDGSPMTASVSPNLQSWINRFDSLDKGDRARLRARATAQTVGSSVGVLAPRPGDSNQIDMLLQSLASQLSPSWTLWVADDAIDAKVSRLLIEAAEADHRIRRVEIDPTISDAERLKCLEANDRSDWRLPLDVGVFLEPEAVFRILDAAEPGIDVVLGDVAIYGAHVGSLEGVVAEPAWSWAVADASRRRLGLIAFRREAMISVGTIRDDSPDPIAACLEAVADKADAIVHIPALLARRPSAQRVVANRAVAAPERPANVRVIIELSDRPDGLGRLIDVIRSDLGADVPIEVFDAHKRGDVAVAAIDRMRGVRRFSGDRTGPRSLDYRIQAMSADEENPILVIIDSRVLPAPGATGDLVGRLHRGRAVLAAGLVVDGDGHSEGAGFIVGPTGGLGPAWRGPINQQSDEAHSPRACSAASMTFAAFRGSAYLAVGGFDPDLESLWRDVDFGLRLEQAGFSMIADPCACALRIEPGPKPDPKQDTVLRRRWSARLAQDDPFYNPLLSSELNHAPGVLHDPWMAARISRRRAGAPEKGRAQPRLTASPHEVVT